MQVFLVSTLLFFLPLVNAAAYGGWGGGAHTFQCPGSDVIRAIAFKSGRFLDAISFRCTNGDWSGWYGGSGGGYHHVYAQGSGFCGLSGRSGGFVDMLCVTDAGSTTQYCFGGSGGGPFTDRSCSQSPGNNRLRLKGFHLRSGRFVDRLEPIWTSMDCQNYLTVQNGPHESWNGNYEFAGWTSGHHRYQKVGDSNKCVYHEMKRWKFNYCSSIGQGNSVYSLPAWDSYNYCVYNLGGSNHWEWYNSGWTNIYPQLQIAGRSSLPLSWGNTVGYWDFLQSGQGYGDSITYTISRHEETTNGRDYTTEEETAFSRSLETSQTHGFEITVGGSFKAFSAEAKYSYAKTVTESTTNSIRNNIINAVSYATSSGTTTTRECTTTMPQAMYNTYVWTVYRASSEANNGASQQTCTFQHQTGACRFVPPNCPIGECQDMNCIYCAPGVDPLTPIATLRAHYPACFEELEGDDMRCHPELNDWSCCSSSQPCAAGEGDCDSNSDCQGSLVCLHDQGEYGYFDICGHPHTGRRLLQTDADVTPVEVDDVDEPEKEHAAATGCGQFDDEAHCEAGPLYNFCRWSYDDRACVLKEGVEEGEMPDTDFTWIYNL